MVRNHLKRIAAPRSWALRRKESTFVTRPNPGRALRLAMPLNHVMKALLDKGRTTKEVRHILFHEEVLVNGRRVYDHRLPVGFMDTISFPSIKERYVLSLSPRGILAAVPQEGADKRLVRVRGKTRVAGRLQLNCQDGTNLLLDKDAYRTGDTLVLSGGKVEKHLPLAVGAHIMLTGGKHLGKSGVVKSLEGDDIVFENEGGTFSTTRNHAFVTGAKEPEVRLR